MADQLITGTTLIEDRRSGTGIIWSCSGINFTANPANTWTYSGGDFASTDTLFAKAPVTLPNGVIVTAVIVNCSVSDETWTLNRSLRNAASSSEALATANMNTEDITISNEIIDNDTYRYWLETSSIDTGDTIFGARIKYKG